MNDKYSETGERIEDYLQHGSWIDINVALPKKESPSCSLDCIVTNGEYVTVAYRYYGMLNEKSENIWFDRINRENLSDGIKWMPMPDMEE